MSLLRTLLLAGSLQGSTGLLADITAQYFERQGKLPLATHPGTLQETQVSFPGFDWHRAGVFASIGAFFIGPFGMLRYMMYDALLPGHHLFREVPLKTLTEVLIFTPLNTLIGSCLNEYFKRDGTWEKVKQRQLQEYQNLLMAAFSVKTLSTYVQLSFQSTRTKYLAGITFGFFLNVYTSWRINVQLRLPITHEL